MRKNVYVNSWCKGSEVQEHGTGQGLQLLNSWQEMGRQAALAREKCRQPCLTKLLFTLQTSSLPLEKQAFSSFWSAPPKMSQRAPDFSMSFRDRQA